MRSMLERLLKEHKAEEILEVMARIYEDKATSTRIHTCPQGASSLGLLDMAGTGSIQTAGTGTSACG